MLSSRDGLRFDRTFREAWLRPGRDSRNWGDRSTMPAWGLLHTAEDQLSVYVGEHYRLPTAGLRRATLRLDGFASAHAGRPGGSLVTTPMRFSGHRLVLNYATSAAGWLRATFEEPDGRALQGFDASSAPALYGDAIAEVYAWKRGSDISALAGKRVRLRFELEDCDLYSYRFTE